MAIKVIEEKPRKRKVKPHFVLTYNYMIGDADGDTSEEVIAEADNPFVERHCKLLNRLKPNKGSWGLMLDRENLAKCLEEKQINRDEYLFLSRTMFGKSWRPEEEQDEEEREISAYFSTEKENDFADAFEDGIQAETSYSFLVFEGVTLHYVGEDGKRKKTKLTGK
jgi:hypothetical protein